MGASASLRPSGSLLKTDCLTPKRNESVEQAVAGYDPQVVAMRWLPLATIVILTAGGSSPEP